MNGAYLDMIGPKGEKITDDNFYIIFNSTADAVPFKLPPANYADSWKEVINTVRDAIDPEGATHKAEDMVTAEGRSIIVLHSPRIA
jgi:glycogen operon protein